MRANIKKTSAILGLMMISLLFTACSHHVPPPFVVKDTYQQEIIDHLARLDVEVLRIGQYRTILIRDKDFVPINRHRLDERDRHILTLIADLIRTDRKVTVTVGSFPRDCERTRRIAWFLWGIGVDARLIETVAQQSDVVDVAEPRIEIQYKVLREEALV